MTPGAHPVHKATIMPRGNALGMVMQLPEGDQTSMSRKQVAARLLYLPDFFFLLGLWWWSLSDAQLPSHE